jgi:nitroreductase
MSVLELIKSRRSVRNFSSKQVNDKDVIKILDAARLAPSGGNRQNWRFIYIKDPQVLRMIKNSSPGFYGDSPAAIVAGLENESSTLGYNLGSLDIGFAVENVLLAAHSLGLGGCAIASFIPQAIKKIVGAPERFKPVLIVSLGYSDKIPESPKKKSLSDIVYLNEYGRTWDVTGEST